MKQVFGLVEKVGNNVLTPYVLSNLPDGEAIRFDYRKMINLVFKSFGLEEATLERQVILSLSIDGATLSTKFLGHVMAARLQDKGKGRCRPTHQ
jgi:hypothetical protein